MLVCGVEEPIQPNPYLFEVGDASYNLASFTDPRLNRYSFVHLPDEGGDGYYPEEATANFRQLLQAVCDQLNAPLTGGWCRPYFSTSEAAAVRLTQQDAHKYGSGIWRLAADGNLVAKKLVEQPRMTAEEATERGRRAAHRTQAHFASLGAHGWNAYHDDELQMATKPLAPAGYWLNTFDREATDDPVEMLTFLVIGNAPPPQAFAAPSLRPTMQAFDKFAPGPSFLAWLAEQPFSVAYIMRDTTDRPGLVVVGTLRIDATALLTANVVRKIDPRLGLVWNYPPVPQV